MDLGRLHPWIVRAAWAVLPFVSGPAFATALDGRSTPVRIVASVALWSLWGAALAASLVLHPVALTVLRVVAPAGVVAAAWAAWSTDIDVAGAAAVASTFVAFVLARSEEHTSELQSPC